MKRRLEKAIQREIEAAIGSEPDMLLMRNAVGQAVFTSEETGKRFVVPFGLGLGSPDLVAILRRGRVGIWFALELKRPGEEPTPEQVKCHEVWRSFGAIVETVTSVVEARAALNRAREVPLQ
jgi:hypothetical protein